MMTAYAVPLTPYGEGRRAVAARDAITDFQKCSSSSTDPLFIEMLPNILRDTNSVHRLHEDGIAETIWKDVFEHPIWFHEADKCTMTRFMSFAKRFKDTEDECWHTR
jgi:hypothetical protein